MGKNKSNDNKILGKRLREAREKIGKGQTEMAEDLGYASRNSITMFETGKREIPKEVALIVSEKTGWDIEYFLDSTKIYKTIQEENHAESRNIYETDHIFWNYLEHIGFGKIYFPLNKEIDGRLSDRYVGTVTTPTGKEIKMNATKFFELQDEINDYIVFKFNRE